MFKFEELVLLRLALDAYKPKPAHEHEVAPLLEKVRALSTDGLIPISPVQPKGNPPPASVVSEVTVRRVFRPLQCAIINVFRSLPPTEWHDITVAFGTVVSACTSVARTEAGRVDFDRLARIALGALADLPLSPRVLAAIETARVAANPVTSPGGQG